MMTDTRSWRDSYLTELEQAATVLPADRRNELLAQFNEHLDGELDGVADAAEAQQFLQRLGDPDDVVAEATADLPMPARPR